MVFNDWFWNEKVWLPPNTTWADTALGSRPVVLKSNYSPLTFAFPMALVFLFTRYLLEKYLFAPIGISLGIKCRTKTKTSTNSILEKAYLKFKILNNKQVQGLAKQVDMDEKQVVRWLRMRRTQDKPSKLTKFCETSWRLLYYLTSFLFACFILYDKPWLWDISKCWTDYSHQLPSNGLWIYYMSSMAIYLSLSISQFFDVKRKDFWEMFIHHIATITFLCLAWNGKFHRIGALTLFVHDFADIFIESGKIAVYTKYQKLSNLIIVLFTVVWTVTRLGLFPFWILRDMFFGNGSVYLPTFYYWTINPLSILFVGLHIFWTYFIIKLLVKISRKEPAHDVRSDSSDVSENETDAS